MAGLLDAATGVLVDGKWRSGGAVAPVRDKFTQLPVAEVSLGSESDAHDAVTSAAAAARRPLPPAQRHQILSEAARLLTANAAEVTANYIAETWLHQGGRRRRARPARRARWRLSAEEAVRIAGEEGAGRKRRRAARTASRSPSGCRAAWSSPSPRFNAPLNTVAHKIGPALAAGNAVVLKPAAHTPLSSMALAAILLEAGLPPGYLNLVHGPGATVGNALTGDARVRFITFTAPPPSAARSSSTRASSRTQMELGANSATIVAGDADLALAARLIQTAGYRKAGQVCTSVQRVLADATGD